MRRSALPRPTAPRAGCRTTRSAGSSPPRTLRGPHHRGRTVHVDLHCHSTASDGECVPAEVARRARQAGLTAIALTDHDTTDGVAAAAAEGEPLGVRVVPGCEFSVKAPWGELHLLGYFLPVGEAHLEAFLRETRAARRRRGEQIVAKLQQLGVPIALDDVDAQAKGGAVGRPHVARALVEWDASDDIR